MPAVLTKICASSEPEPVSYTHLDVYKRQPQTERGSYYARAQLFSAKGDYARAVADFDKLVSLAPDNKEFQQQRQSAIAMQTELARATAKPPAPVPAPAAAAAATATAVPPPPSAAVPLSLIHI